MKKRFFKTKPKNLPKGYDSFLEYNLHQTALKDTQHHPDKTDLIKYTIPHTYQYDFLFTYNDSMFVIETKGRFRDSTEARKYTYIRDYLTDWHVYKESACKSIELLLIFENASTCMPFAKARKDGTKLSHGEWASKNNFRWLCQKRGDLVGVETAEDIVNKFTEKMNENT